MRTLSFFALLALALQPLAARAQCCPAEGVQVIGHRGTGSNRFETVWPENTIEGANQAFAEGADMVEIDVQLTSDGQVVVIHDPTIGRTTNSSGCVQSMTLAELQTLDASGPMTGAGIRLPSLPGFLARVPGPVNVEVKLHDSERCPGQDIPTLAAAVVTAIRADTRSRRILVSSLSLPPLRAIRAMHPTLPIALLSGSVDDAAVARAEGFEALNIHHAAVTDGAWATLAASGLEINVYTVNSASDIDRLLGLGVDGIITDETPLAAARRTAFCDGIVCPDAGSAGAGDAGSAGAGDAGSAGAGDAGNAGTGDAGNGADSGSVGDAGSADDAGATVDAGSGTGTDGGCACRATASDSRGTLAVALVVALLLVRRRRR